MSRERFREKETRSERDVMRKKCHEKGVSSDRNARERVVKRKSGQEKELSRSRDAGRIRCQGAEMSRERDVMGKNCCEKGLDSDRGRRFHEKEIYLKTEKKMSRNRDVKRTLFQCTGGRARIL